MTLYELTNDIKQLEAVLDTMEDGDECKAAVQSYLGGLEESSLSDKLEGYVMYMRTVQAETVAIDSEIARLQAMSRSRVSRYNSLNETLKWFFETTGKTEAKAGIFTVKRIGNGGKRPMLAPESIQYDTLVGMGLATQDWEPKYTVDKIEIYKRLDSGEEEIAGFKLGERGWRVEVK